MTYHPEYELSRLNELFGFIKGWRKGTSILNGLKD